MLYISQQRRGIGPHLSHTSNSVCLPCVLILFLESSHVWEESYLCLDFDLEKRTRMSYREKKNEL